MLTLLFIILIIAAVLVILAVLLQPGKGDLSATFGGISAQFGAVFGMQKATDLLAKITKILAFIILLLVLVTNRFFIGKHEVQQLKPVTQGAEVPVNKTPMKAPPMPTPEQGGE